MPDWAPELRARLSSLDLPPEREAEIVEELSQHLGERWQELVAGGSSPEEATRVALAELGGSYALARELGPLRQARASSPPPPAAATGHVLGDLWLDAKYALRQSLKRPGFAIAAVVSLALGIGATTAIFSVVHGVLLEPLPFPQADRLVGVYHSAPALNIPLLNQGPATFFTYRAHSRAFEALGAWETNDVAITGRNEPERVEALAVTAGMLPMLGVEPALGRMLAEADDAPGSPPRAMLAWSYWQRRFGSAPDAIGQLLTVDGTPYEIVGVLPRSFRFFDNEIALALPMAMDPAAATDIEFDFQVIGRLRPGITLAQANDDVARMIPLLPAPFRVVELKPNVRPLAADVLGDIARVLWILLGAVAVVLLIACGNVANLFLIRAESRQQELATRAALGASHRRLAQVLLTESVLLALAGGALGLGLAQAAIGGLRRLAPAELPRVGDIDINLTVVMFTVAVSVLSGVLFGLLVVFRFGRPSAAVLKEGGRSASEAPGRHRTRNLLAITQVALALTLLVTSGLMVRTFFELLDVDPGFTRPGEVQTFRLSIPEGLIPDSQQVARTFQNVADRLAQVPGVQSVGFASSVTMDGEDNTNPVRVEGVPVIEGDVPPLRRYKTAGPGYFETMGIRFVAGRPVTWAEVYQGAPVVVVSAPLAREFWKSPSGALGKRIRSSSGAPWRTIVGVVGDERDDGLNRPPTPMVYWPLLNESYRWRFMVFAVRSIRVGRAGFLEELQQAVWSVNPNLPLAGVQTLEEIRARSVARTSFAMVMLIVATAVALLLGMVGVYGVIAYVAAQRTREIGLRLALGAEAGQVRRLFLNYGLRLVVPGILLGLGVALGVTRVMSALLFGVSAADPLTYVAASLILAAVILLATYLPARRASQVDPLIALRTEV